jgi:signal transduction histidine kinase
MWGDVCCPQVNTIRCSGETLLTLISDILDFSRIEVSHPPDSVNAVVVPDMLLESWLHKQLTCTAA